MCTRQIGVTAVAAGAAVEVGPEGALVAPEAHSEKADKTREPARATGDGTVRALRRDSTETRLLRAASDITVVRYITELVLARLRRRGQRERAGRLAPAVDCATAMDSLSAVVHPAQGDPIRDRRARGGPIHAQLVTGSDRVRAGSDHVCHPHGATGQVWPAWRRRGVGPAGELAPQPRVMPRSAARSPGRAPTDHPFRGLLDTRVSLLL